MFTNHYRRIGLATEDKIMDLIRENLPSKTVLSITHRLEAALKFDRVVVLEEGKIAFCGDPKEAIQEAEIFRSLQHLDVT